MMATRTAMGIITARAMTAGFVCGAVDNKDKKRNHCLNKIIIVASCIALKSVTQ